MSIHKLDDSAPVDPIERVDDIVSVKHREQPFHCLHRVTLARCSVFPEDPPGVLEGAKHSILVRSIHRLITLDRDSNRDERESFPAQIRGGPPSSK